MSRTELTAEKKVLLKVYFDEATGIIYNTQPADRATAEEAIRALYAKENLPAPEFVWVKSPVEAREVVKKLGGEWFLTDLWGQHDVYWVQHYRYAARIGAKFTTDDLDYLENWFKVAKSMMWWWPYDTHCICCERPEQIHVNDDSELSNENGPAVRFRDGVEIYSIDGHDVPKFVVTNPETITVDKIKKYGDNAETKRIMVARMGAIRYLREIGAKCIDRDQVDSGVKDENGRPYMITRGLFIDKEGAAWLVGTDGSTPRTYFMSVNPKMKTCADAHYSICGFRDDQIIASG